MAVSKARRRPIFTFEDYLLLPADRNLYQIIDGDLYVAPSPTVSHQEASKRILYELVRQLERRGLARVLPAPMDVRLDATNVVQPDILVIRPQRAEIIEEHPISGAPDLVVEVVSPSTRVVDLRLKRKLYARFGVQEYWLVYPKSKEIEVLSFRDGELALVGRFGERARLRSPLFPRFVLPVRAVFAGQGGAGGTGA